jgi:hypothetical protein
MTGQGDYAVHMDGMLRCPWVESTNHGPYEPEGTLRRYRPQ